MEKLVRQAKRGDKQAFVDLMDACMQSMYKTAYAYFGNDHDAADVIQETILVCWQKLPQLKKDRYFKTWMTRILVNNCNAYAQSRKNVTALDAVEEFADERPSESTLEWQDMVSSLDEKYRLPIVLRYVQGFKAKEVAEILGTSESTVTTWLDRGRKQLESYMSAAVREGVQ